MPSCKPIIRLARPEEGPAIGERLKAWGGPAWEWLDWSDVYPFWLVAEQDGDVIGFVNVAVSKPFARVDHVYLAPSLPRKRKGLAKTLAYAALAYCKVQGAQAVISAIDRDDVQWLQIAKKRGWVTIGEGYSVIKRCL
jgi:L-amino acid N-acyltransferase YncA